MLEDCRLLNHTTVLAPAWSLCVRPPYMQQRSWITFHKWRAAVTVSNGNGVSEEQKAAIERALKIQKHSSKRKKERDKGKHKVKAKAKKSKAKKSKDKGVKKKSKDSRGDKKGSRPQPPTDSESADSADSD